MFEDETIGRQIAQHRKARGMTQVALAQQAAISTSLLRKVEQGSRDATPVLIASVARALAVDVTTLTGQPYDRGGRRPDRIHSLMPALRRTLAYWETPPSLDTAPRTIDKIAGDAHEIAVLRNTDRNAQAIALVPSLLLETLAALHESTSSAERAQLIDITVTLLYVANSVTHKTGYDDLATITADRIALLAPKADEPIVAALSAYTRAGAMLRIGAYDAGLQLITDATGTVSAHQPAGDDKQRMLGSLHLRSAVLAARGGRADVVDNHIAEARRIADELGTESDGMWRSLAFGPANVAVHEVAAAVELGDGARAMSRAEGLRLPSTFSKSRQAHHYMDLSRALLWQGRHDQALTTLHKARTLAPQQTRHHPTTREVLRMLVRAHRRANEPLARFSSWVGGPVQG